MTVQITTLENGLRVATDQMADLETAAVGVWVGVGARDEDASVNGISHMLEHMAFKGTRRRTALQIAEEIEAVGGHLNAYTSREQTAYFARILKNDLPLAVDILADILQNSTFAQEELERERTVIIQEIGQTLDIAWIVTGFSGIEHFVVGDVTNRFALVFDTISKAVAGVTQQHGLDGDIIKFDGFFPQIAEENAGPELPNGNRKIDAIHLRAHQFAHGGFTVAGPQNFKFIAGNIKRHKKGKGIDMIPVGM